MRGPVVPCSVLLVDISLAAAVLLCIRTSVSLSTANGRRVAGDDRGVNFALTLGCEVVLMVLADVELPRHRDIIFLHQSRGCCHAILDVSEEIGGPGGVLVWRADPCAQA
jgi:hypothetical protein